MLPNAAKCLKGSDGFVGEWRILVVKELILRLRKSTGINASNEGLKLESILREIIVRQEVDEARFGHSWNFKVDQHEVLIDLVALAVAALSVTMPATLIAALIASHV